MTHSITTILIYICFSIGFHVFCNSNGNSERTAIASYINQDEPAFLFLYPRTFLSGKNETVCIVFQSKYFPVRIKIDFKIKSKHTIYNEVLHSETECFNISIPLHRSLEILTADISVYLECGGIVLQEKNYESILIYPSTDIIFMETDRHIYRQGDVVKIRIIRLTQDMMPPSNTTVIDVKIINPQGFIVEAVNNLIPRLGLLHFDYRLANTTSLGTWVIECNGHRKTFLVKNYLLPRFKIYISAVKSLFTSSPFLPFNVCAKYTFGKGLRGHTFAKITYSHDNTFSISKLHTLKSNGCVEFKFNNNELQLSNVRAKYQTLNIFVTVTEDGTNHLETETFHINIYQMPFEIKFLTGASYYQPGLPYKNKLKITRGFLKNYTGQFAEICYQTAWKNDWNLKPMECATFQFDKDGVIPFSILPLKENVRQVKITAKSLNHTNVVINPLTLHRWYSSSTSYLKIERNSKWYTKCKAPQQFTVYFNANKLKHNEHVTFYYMMTANNDILILKKHYHIVNKTFVDFEYEMGNTLSTHNKYTKMENYIDKFVLKFKTPEKIYSKGNLIVFYIHKGETISNSINLHVEKCLPINITAKWMSTNLKPGESGKLSIKTKKHAICAISSVDIANNFLDNNKRLNINKIIQPFILQREFKSVKPSCIFGTSHSKDVMMPGTNKYLNSSGFDSYEDFLDLGISMITNTHIISKPCKNQDDLVGPYYQIINEDEYTKAEQDYIDVRTYFPATWHWDLIETDHHGSILLKSRTPDTITTWNTNIICTSTEGIGVTNVKLLATKLYFVDFNIPEKLKRNEILNLQILAHNYFNYSLPIKLYLNTTLEVVDPDTSDDVIEVPSNEIYIRTIRLQSNKIMNAIISVQMKLAYNGKDWPGPSLDGSALDKIEKQLKVVHEGYQEIKTQTILLCGLRELHNLTRNLVLPEERIIGSESVSVIMYSDLIGPVMQNLEDLILLPTGCGEQIMAVMAPNFYVLKYLKSINNLHGFVRKRIIKNLQIGYQRILEYLHSDGSFSAFGNLDAQGSMFLTTFVLRSLNAASEYIFIDPLVINNALIWILKHQLENGCFASVSHVFQDMGGASLENSTSALTSYVMINLLQSNISVSERVRQNSVYCIRGQFNPDVYSLAINTYALYLLEDISGGDSGLSMLVKRANTEDNFMWWNSTRDSRSMDIETAGYVLMSFMHKLSNENLIYANAIVRWLLNQRNAHGGFSSSQDTVVALDAITRYAAAMNERNPDLNISVFTDAIKYTAEFRKKDISKEEVFNFSNGTRKVTLSYEGTGCVLTQFLVRYNVDHPKNNEAFELNIKPTLNTANCMVSTISPCFKYANAKQPTMIVMEICLPTGYDSEKESLHNLVGTHKNLKKVEELSSKVVFYFTDLTNETICLPFNISRNSIVSELYKSNIWLYEYYNPEHQVIKAYDLPNDC